VIERATLTHHYYNPAEVRILRVGLALSLFLVSAVCAVVSIPVFLLLGPGLCLFFMLSLGYFPGERVIERVASWRSRNRAAAVPSIEPASQPLNLVAKAGRQIAYALAMRPPPRFSVFHT